MHFPAAAHDRYVRRHVAIYECATGVREPTLPVHGQTAFEMNCAGSNLHSRTILLTTVTRTGWILAALALFLIARPASAHPVPFSYLDLRIQSNAIEGTLVVHIFDAAHDLNLDKPETLLDSTAARRNGPALIAMLSGRLQVLVDGRPASTSWSGPEVLADRQSLQFQIRFAVDRAPGTVTVTAGLFPYDPTHQTFINIYEGQALTQAILDRNKPSFEYFAGTRQGILAVVERFVPAGIHHILIGPDHLLFLVGLLLLGGGIRKLAIVVTAFTVAHSITLSLAALNIVSPPSRLIEPAIALSIVYVGADNLLVKGGRDVRKWIAFAFGFIHGFGFASVLREMDLPARALGWSLFSFNFGVEIGQLLVVVTVASALAMLRSRSEIASRHLAFAGSIVVIVAGAFWFLQRVFFPGT
jgi:hydrogenase/urease accessory protein HupE